MSEHRPSAEHISEYLNLVQSKFRTGDATEHSYRSALEFLFKGIDKHIDALNEPKRVQCGAPDFIINRGEIAIGHCEAKDIGIDLTTMKGANADQKKRYLSALPNLIYTNCLDFEFYRNGEIVNSISIGTSVGGIQPKSENFETLLNQIKDFLSQHPQTITSSKKLAQMMAGKATLIKDILARSLAADKDSETELMGQYKAFQTYLIHDIKIEEFADIYAETIAYGLFAARLHDDTPNSFSREEALKLLPKSNPFLRSLFTYIAGSYFDDRIKWIVDDLATVFQACDVSALMADFGKFTQRNDPFLHFYETFLSAYNPAKRKARGVWYTPEAVVNFIVRAVDDVLQKEFDLPLGLGDSSKVMIDWDTGQKAITKKGQVFKSGEKAIAHKEVHRVQILDPATGTGTFLAEVLKQIAPKVKAQAEGMWSNYIEKDLIPRVHGFELLMASYAMCHMKLDMMLSELGYKHSDSPPRISVYLTNSLEEGEEADQSLPFAQWLSKEAKEANSIKRDVPIMCVIGNPPYSGESKNKGEWIMHLMEDYKKEPGGKLKLDEKNPKWINDDYIKFIRFAEHMISKTGYGVLGFITNHGYLDNPSFRGVRWHLLSTFDKIYIIDLHGNTNKKELVPEGLVDKNVFDIKPGVAIIIGVKKVSDKKERTPLGIVQHTDVWGSKNDKGNYLWESRLADLEWNEIENRGPHYMFVPWNYDLEEIYRKGFSLETLMPVNSIGIVTGKDGKYIAESPTQLEQQIGEEFDPSLVRPISYRPFEASYIYLSWKKLERAREEVMQHYLQGDNIGLLVTKALRDREFAHIFITNKVSEAIFLSGTTASNAMNLPLYLYPEPDSLDKNRRINFNKDIQNRLTELATHVQRGSPNELNILDYIYGVLHNPEYRTRYRQVLTIDYPHIPYPQSPEIFWAVSDKGALLRRLHLMEPTAIGDTPYPFCGSGEGIIKKVQFVETGEGVGNVHINQTQRFENVPRVAWEFPIGGYRPAQKWLDDRKETKESKGKALDFAAVHQYQKIIKILSETDRIMKTLGFSLD